MLMTTLMKSSNGIAQVSADARLLAERMIFLEGKIDGERAGEFVRQILILNQENEEKAIRVLINSGGGEVSAGLMIYEPILGERFGGNTSSIRAVSEGLLEMKNKLNKILALHTKKSEKEIEAAVSYDHFFSAEEAVAFGLCDKVVGFENILEG